MIPPFRSEPSLHLLMKTDRIRSLHIFMKSARIRIFGIIFCLGSLPMRFCRAPTVFNVICKAFQGCPLVLTHYFETASVAARKNLGTGTIPNIPITSLGMSFQINSSSRYTRWSDLIPRGKYRTPSYVLCAPSTYPPDDPLATVASPNPESHT